MTPEDFSIGHFLKELFLAECTELSTWDVNAAYFHLINIEFLHYPHSPVDHLVSCPEHRVCRRKDQPHIPTPCLFDVTLRIIFRTVQSYRMVFPGEPALCGSLRALRPSV